MSYARIQLAYRQVIDATSAGPFAEGVFADTYQEYRAQALSYDPDRHHDTWAELKAALPRAAVNLPFKVGYVLGPHVATLQNQMPGGLTDTLGVHELPFADYRFELLASSLNDRQQHNVAVTFLTAPLTWLGTVGNLLLLSEGNRSAGAVAPGAGAIDTFLIELRPGVSIATFEPR